MAKLKHNNYGKGRVRLAKVIRDGAWHTYKQYTVQVNLEGGQNIAFTDGDNSPVLPTDTMKNSVYAIASQHDMNSPEAFAFDLTAHFLATAPHLTQATVSVAEHAWRRMVFGEEEHTHAFIGGHSEKRTAVVGRAHDGATLESGLTDLIVLKTTESAFVGFFKDQYTTLPEERDRLMGTNITAKWTYNTAEADYNAIWEIVRTNLLDVFAHHDSESVQHTLFAMGTAVLDAAPEIEAISLSMPNIHNVPFDLSRLGLENKNEIFVPIDEPHGLIEATVARD